MSTASIARGAVANFLTRLLAVALGLALMALVARQGPAAQGVFSLLVATEAVFAALFSGLGLVMARQVSHHGDEAAPWLSGALVLALACGLAGAAAFAVAAQALAHEPAYRYLPWLAAAAPFLLLTPTMSGLYLGLGRMGPVNTLSVLPSLLTVAALALAWAGQGALPLALVLGTWLAARAGVGLLAAGHGLRRFGGLAPDLARWSGQAKFCAVLGLTNLISWLNYRVDLFIVERLVGLTQAGIYAIAVTVAELLWFVSSAVSTAAYARIGTPDTARAAELTVRIVHLNLAVLLLATPVLVALAWWGLPVFFGPAYAASLPLLVLLLPGVWAYASASTLSAFYTNHLGRPRLSATVAGTSLLINVAACLWLVPRLGVAGAAVATSASYLLAIAWGVALFRRHAGLSWRAVLRPDGARLLHDLTGGRWGRAGRLG